jgi:hypothetical protein
MINSEKISLCKCQQFENAIRWAWNLRWEYIAFPHVPLKKCLLCSDEYYCSRRRSFQNKQANQGL